MGIWSLDKSFVVRDFQSPHCDQHPKRVDHVVSAIVHLIFFCFAHVVIGLLYVVYTKATDLQLHSVWGCNLCWSHQDTSMVVTSNPETEVFTATMYVGG